MRKLDSLKTSILSLEIFKTCPEKALKKWSNWSLFWAKTRLGGLGALRSPFHPKLSPVSMPSLNGIDQQLRSLWEDGDKHIYMAGYMAGYGGLFFWKSQSNNKQGYTSTLNLVEVSCLCKIHFYNKTKKRIVWAFLLAFKFWVL